MSYLGTGVLAAALMATVEAPSDATADPTPEASAPAAADRDPRPDRSFLRVGADFWHENVAGFPIDGDGREYAYDHVGSTRLRAGARTSLGTPRLELDVEVDLYAARVYGSVPRIGTERLDELELEAQRFGRLPVTPRKFSIRWRSPIGQIELGQTTSQWGLGIVANSGERDGRLFGDRDRGSVVDRLMVATAPLVALGHAPNSLAGRLTLVVGGDLVYADDNAELFHDTDFTVQDTAWQGVVSAMVRPRADLDLHPVTKPRHDLSGGLYAVRRVQDDAEGTFLNVWVVDGFVQYVQQWPRKNRIRYAMEMAWIKGESDRLVTEQGRDELEVDSFGAAFELEYAWQDGILPMSLSGMAGMASGDGDPDDDRIERFTFHSDYDVGLVLFDHVVPTLQRQAIERVSDPLRAKDPPQGAERLVTRGNVSGVSYGALRLAMGPWHGLDFGVQWVSMMTSAPFTDPFRSFEHGGDPTNPYGGSALGSVGNEVDVALRYQWRGAGETGPIPSVRLTYGAFLPGEVFEGPDGDLGTVHLAQLKLAIDYRPL